VPTPENTRIAVLIDADNTSRKYVKALLEEVAKYGTPTVKRAYGDWTSNHLNGWKTELNRNAIVPIQQFAYTQGKNSTDSLLIIDAMDLLYTGNLDGFAIVSSDSDFTSLATRLREAGKAVYGLGQRKTPEPFRTACTRFIYLEVLTKDEPVDEPADEGEVEGEGETAALPDLRRLLTSAIDATSQDDGWAHLGGVGNYLSKTESSFDPRNYGFGRLITLLRDQDYLDVDTEGSPTVRLKPKTTTSKVVTRKRTTKKTAAKKAAAKKA
jgi:uncharacterized protein (TIGR00288 family)